MDDVMIMRCRGAIESSSNGPPATDHQQQKIPIWIGSECKLLSGVSKVTTCAEIIQLLVDADDDPSKFVIVEKWRKMERKLDSHVRILKVWTEWGDQKNDVALILRQHHSSSSTTCSATTTNDGYIDKRGCSNRTFRRKSAPSQHNHHHNKAVIVGMPTGAASSGTNTNYVERSAGKDDVQMPESMERILSLVLTQGETIQAQLKKLRFQEEQIERYEEQMHRIRSLKDGENYVVDSYLNDDSGAGPGSSNLTSSKGLFGLSRSGTSSLKKRDKNSKKLLTKSKLKDKSSGASKKHNGKSVIDGRKLLDQLSAKVQSVDDIGESTDVDPTVSLEEGLANSEAIIQQNELMERICQVNGELTKEEERLVKLGLKIKKYQQQSASTSKDGGEESSDDEDDKIDDENCHSTHRETEQQKFASQLSLELESLRKITAEQSHEIEQNELHLTEIETILDEKHDCIVHLTYEIQLLDVESDLLQQRLLQITKPLQHQYEDVHDQYSSSMFLQNSSAPSAQIQPPPYEEAISSSMLANYLLPFNHVLDTSSDYCNNDDETGVADIGESNSTRPVAIPDVTTATRPMPTMSQSCPSRTSTLQTAPPLTKMVPNCTCNSNYCHCPAMNSSTTSRSTTELGLHSSSSSRDHQDNDSNSDTGISSLHSSGDENMLFTLDTLV